MAIYPILGPNDQEVYYVTCDDGCGSVATILHGSFLPDGWYALSNNPAATKFWQFVDREHAAVWARRRTMPPGEQFRQIDRRLGMSLSEIARVCGVTRDTVARWRSGRTERVPIASIRLLEQVLRARGLE